jgi:hypothetical protein
VNPPDLRRYCRHRYHHHHHHHHRNSNKNKNKNLQSTILGVGFYEVSLFLR